MDKGAWNEQSGLPCSPPGDLPDPGIKSTPLTCPALAGGFFITEPPGKSRDFPNINEQNLEVPLEERPF